MGNHNSVSATKIEKRYIEIISSVSPQVTHREFTKNALLDSSKKLSKMFRRESGLIENESNKENSGIQKVSDLILTKSLDGKIKRIIRAPDSSSAGEIIMGTPVLKNKPEEPVQLFFIKPICYIPKLKNMPLKNEELAPKGVSFLNDDSLPVSPEKNKLETSSHKSSGSKIGSNKKNSWSISNKKKTNVFYKSVDFAGEKYRVSNKFKNGCAYEGEVDQNRTRNGLGSYCWTDGSKYTGQWTDNMPQGQGKLETADKDVYEGEWLAGLAHGKGTLTTPLGSMYVGQWKNDLQHGNGVETWIDGAIYEGQFEEGQKNGKGKQVFADKSVYMGGFLNNQMAGNGVLELANGKVFEGTWRGNKMEGEGVIKWKTGRVFNGLFLAGKISGKGEMISGKGIRTLGIWEEGKLKNEVEVLEDSLFLEIVSS